MARKSQPITVTIVNPERIDEAVSRGLTALLNHELRKEGSSVRVTVRPIHPTDKHRPSDGPAASAG